MTTETNQTETTDAPERTDESATITIDVPDAAPEQGNSPYLVKKPHFPARFKYVFWALAFAGMGLFTNTAAHAEAGIYNPAGCEFQVELPSEPYTTKKCNPDKPADCHDVTTFTKVFDMAATVDVTLTCNKAEKNMFEKYSGETMVKTLEAMIDHDSIENYEKDFSVTDDVKRAVIIGSGTSGRQKKIYTSQLWIGHQSVLTIEGALVGDYVAEADTMFADIVKSVQTVKQAKKAAEKAEKKDEPKTDEKTEKE